MLFSLKTEENIKRKDRDEIRPKTIFSENGNGWKNFTFLSTREQKNVHTVYVKQVYVKQVCVRVYSRDKIITVALGDTELKWWDYLERTVLLVHDKCWCINYNVLEI